MSIADSIPNLASSSKDFLTGRLEGFLANGATSPMAVQLRTLMTEFKIEVKKQGTDGAPVLSDDGKDLLNFVADWYSQLGIPLSVETVQATRAALGAETLKVYEAGAKVFAERSCAACHTSNDLRPLAPQPAILLQKPGVLRARFAEFKARTWGTVMPDFVESLSEDEIKSLEIYVSLTHPAELTQMK